MLGPLFPSEYRKKAYIKNFEGGGLRGPKHSLCWISSRAFFAPEIWTLERGFVCNHFVSERKSQLRHLVLGKSEEDEEKGRKRQR